MSPLELYPELSDLTREEIEAHLSQVRARRVLAALEYVAGQNLKVTYEAEKIQKKIQMAYERLGRAIAKLDAADDAVQKHMIDIEELKQELGFAVSQVTVTEDSDDV